MGKVKRARNKYHFSSVQGDFTSSTETKFTSPTELPNFEIGSSFNSEKTFGNDSSFRKDLKNNKPSTGELELVTFGFKNDKGPGWKVPEENIFGNIDIDVDKLETSVQLPAYTKPLGTSISKCIKRSVTGSGMNIMLRKQEKRELRKNLFVKKIDAIHQKFKKIKINKKNNLESSDEASSSEIPSDTGSKVKLTKIVKPQKQISGPSSVKKSSKRQQKAMSKMKNKQDLLNRSVHLIKKIISDPLYCKNMMNVVTNAIQKKVYTDL